MPSATGAGAESAPHKRDSRVRLEREGRGTIDEIVASAREVPWTLNVLQLLWTAGPVVYLAMQGSHYLGFGTAASPRSIVFFAAYTFLLGAIGLVARFAAGQLRGRRQRTARAHLTRALDVLPDLMFAARDIGLAQMSADARRREAARVLLYKTDLGPDGVGLAVEELTGDGVLAEAAKRADTWRRLGMYSRVRDSVEELSERRAAALERLSGVAPEATEVLRTRLNGDAPSPGDGIPRGEGFLERILAAADRDDPALMRLADVEDLLVLTLELISGREIVRLTFEYRGDWRLARALDGVEQAQNTYRMVQGAVASHLQSLATLLVDSGATGLCEDELSMPSPALLERAATALQVLTLAHQHAPSAADDRRRRTLRQAVVVAKRLYQASDQAKLQRAGYQRALQRWQGLRQSAAAGDRGRGLRIAERRIRLADQQKLQIAAELCQYLDELDIRPGERGMLRGGKPLGELDAKRLAIRLVLILEPVLHFGDASIQRAIETSHAAYFYGLESGFSASAKAALAAAAAQDVRQDLGRTAERLALRLARVYQVPLTQPMIEFLSTHYGGQRERLEIIEAAGPTEPAAGPSFSPPAPALQVDAARWRQLVRNAERVLASRAPREGGRQDSLRSKSRR